MLTAFFKALFAALIDYFEKKEIERAHNEALIENARRDAEALVLAGRAATEGRMQNAEVELGANSDPTSIRERMRTRDPGTN
jgi:hypothetical protein